MAQPIHAFRHEVAAQRGKHIAAAVADSLLAQADALLSDLYGTPAPNASAVTSAIGALLTAVQADRSSGAIDNDGIATSLLTKLDMGDQANNGTSGDLQTTTFRYDANGNRINREFPGPQGPRVQGTDYAYDRENRLVEAQDYQQNLQGNRVDRAVTRPDYDGDGRRLVKEYDPKDGSGGTKRLEYVFDGLDPIAEYTIGNPQYDNFYRGDMGRIITLHHFPSGAAGQLYWYRYDGLGSVSGLTKHDGQSTHNYRYEPYGQIEMPPGNFSDPHNHYTFTGQELDENTGLYDFFARNYDADVGVWLQQDPYHGRLSAPKTLHRYGYVEANPITFIDRHGYIAVLLPLIIGITAFLGVASVYFSAAQPLYDDENSKRLIEKQEEQEEDSILGTRAIQNDVGKLESSKTNIIEKSQSATSLVFHTVKNTIIFRQAAFEIVGAIKCLGELTGITPENEEPIVNKSGSKQLAENMQNSGMIRQPNTAAHHIVAENSPKAAEARGILNSFGVDINSAENGVFLPDSPNSTATGMNHRILHTDVYYNEVNSRLRMATTKGDVIKVLEDIRDELLKGVFPR